MAIARRPKNSFSILTVLSLLSLFYSWAIKSAVAEGIYIPGPDEVRNSRRAKDQENYYRNESEADRLFREANRARLDLDAEKSRSLFRQAARAPGSKRASFEAGIYLRSYLPKYPVTPECETLYKHADQLVQQNHLAEALAAFQDMRSTYPKLEWVEIGLATIHLKRDDPERAATCARRALAINPEYVDAWLILTHDCLMHSDMAGARMSAQKAHELDPFNNAVNQVFNGISAEYSKDKAD